MEKMSYFYMLKDELLSKYQEEYPSWKGAIHDFKTREIANFQQILEKRVGSRISEKWFYTHIKPIENKKLPRIDTLDMLSEFVGYTNWEAFVEWQHEKVEYEGALVKVTNQGNSKKVLLLVAGIFSVVFLLGFLFLQKKQLYSICFVDADKGTAIEGSIEISIFKPEESPIIRQADANGCVHFEESTDLIHFAVRAPYYKSDTIIRSLRKAERNEVVKLRRDDFALMIHLFSTNNLEDWQKRRQQLNKMIAEDAVIFQVGENNLGLEMYNKTEFINKLTMPINSLKNIRIVNTQYRKGRILKLRFIQE